LPEATIVVNATIGLAQKVRQINRLTVGTGVAYAGLSSNKKGTD
jgi:hypothetical protein